jgi:hypothetical protein
LLGVDKWRTIQDDLWISWSPFFYS